MQPWRRHKARMAGASKGRGLRKALERAERLLDAGNAVKAAELIEDALGQDPANAQAHHLAARVLAGGGNLDAALMHAKLACDAAPEIAEYLTNIGQLLRALGRDKEAAGAFSAAFQRNPNSSAAAAQLGFQLRQIGDLGGALGAFGHAVALDNGNVNAYLGWVDLLGRATTPGFDEGLAVDLLTAVSGPLSAPEELAPAIARQLRHKIDFAAAPDGLDPTDPLLVAFLTRCLNVDPVIERGLCQARSRLMAMDAATWKAPESALARLIALQGFINEYVMFESTEETTSLSALQGELEAALAASGMADPHRLLAFAMYRPLVRLAGAEALIGVDWDRKAGGLAEIVRLTLANALVERRLREAIPTLASIADKTSLKVRAQYEEHPYPRWTAPTPQGAVAPSVLLKQMFGHFEPPLFLDGRLSVLIAGCGTGRHTAAVAQAFPKADITAVDLSLSSIAYGKRMLDELGISKRVRMIQTDILEAGRLEGPFDMIQSVGVLHHMAEPIAGWRVLAGLLRPGGVMKIGLYAERGRRGVLKCRDIIAEEGIGSSDADMRAFRHRLLNDRHGKLAGDDFDKVTERADFYSLSMCRDLLFHVQEVCYTPARIKRELAALGLRFIGFEEVESFGLAQNYRARFPSNPTLDDLDNWEALEASLDDPPEGYVFWCQKPVP
jgi:SAM-dependent methyltransferase